jgi:putative Mg2+ transporter-C (MgtC) family protein
MNWILQLEILIRVAAAMLLGGLIGLEREIADKPAGLRTHMLVAATAALLVSLSRPLVESFTFYTDVPRGDPIRIVQAIIVGIGFLGAGTIIQGGSRNRIEGLTTGASLLLSTALGIAVAARQYILAIGTTALALIVLAILGLLERWLSRKKVGKSEPG